MDLKSIIDRCPRCLENRERFKSWMSSVCPSEVRTANVLAALLECGILNSIKSKKQLTSTEIRAFCVQAENEYGIAEKYTQEAVHLLAKTFDVPIAGAAEGCGVSQPSTQTSNSNYAVIQREDGYYISGLNGFEDAEMVIPGIIGEKRIKGIADGAFSGCKVMETVHISEGIEVIEDRAFYGCSSLSSVTFPRTLKRIGSPVPKYGESFSGTKLTEVSFPDSVAAIARASFSYCNSLRKVNLPQNMEEISAYTFEGCDGLCEVHFPARLKIIRSGAFARCTSLKEIYIPHGTNVIEKGAFSECKPYAIHIPSTVYSIGTQTDDVYYSLRSTNSRGTFCRWLDQDKLTIYCTSGSTAMAYAREHGIKCREDTALSQLCNTGI